MQASQGRGYVQPKLFTPPPPSISQPLSSPRGSSSRFEYGPTNPIVTISGDIIPRAGVERYDFILPNAPLTEEERKYCRCLLRVEGNAVNPYAVCTSRVGSQVQACSQYYDWPAMSFEVLLAYAQLHKINTMGLSSRDDVLQAIALWKQSRNESFY